MKILVVGGGGREHAIVWKLAQSSHAPQLYCAPGNAGIAELATCVPIAATDLPAMVDLAVKEAFDLVVVAPDDPLALGMVDALQEKGILAFGPNKAAARIEASKVFSKDLMRKYGIPTAGYTVLDSLEAALAHAQSCDYPTVVKADGLALGKGVIICQTQAEAEAAVKKIMGDKVFGASGDRIVFEEFMVGPEVSVLCFVDGETILPMLSAQDHKPAYDGDKGPNTGGMGTFSPSPKYTPVMAEEVMRTIMLPTVQAMAAEGCPFSGVLYFGLMLTANGIKVLEYNARFGDPETQVILPLLKTDLVDVMLANAKGELSGVQLDWQSGSCVCVVMASGGYPGSYPKGLPIAGLDNLPEDTFVFHAGTKATAQGLVTAGGRVLGVTACGPDIPGAREKAYAAVSAIHFDGAHYRTDIGLK